MLTDKQLRRAKTGKAMAIGLRSASTSEIDEIKKQLRDHNIPFEHRIHGLRYHGMIAVNPKKETK